MNSNKHILSTIGDFGLTGIYRNRYGSQRIMVVYIADIGIIMESHITINKYNWSRFRPIHKLYRIDPTILNDLLNDGYKFNYKEGIAVG